MLISYGWLRDLVGIEVEPRELAARLTMAGLAVDAVREAGDDFVFEFDLTSNRPDCLSHLGIAREVAALYSVSVRMAEVAAARTGGRASEFTSVEISDLDLCPRYAGRVVRGVRIGPSPDWLARRLQAIGQRPINNVADITNYVLHETGQPLHAFDLAVLDEKRIVVRRARAGETMKTLDGVERKLDSEMLVIADASRAVAVAGVMGGEETEISESTSDVLIESAYFNPQSVRRTSKMLGLQTEASYRFERGTDYEGVRYAQDRCVALICELAGGEATEDAIDVYPQRIAAPVVSLRPRRVYELTGLSVESDESLRILNALGFEMESEESGESDALAFRAPSWRTDVRIEEDLVEEVARVHGYEKIREALPPSGVAGAYLTGERRRRAFQQTLTALGFNEAINFSFIEAGQGSRFQPIDGLVSDESDEAFVSLSNPIIEGASLMRPTLLPGLLASVRHNLNHGTRDVRLFESGRVFAAGGEEGGEARPNELESLALVLTGETLEAGRTSGRAVDFFDLKGAVEAATDSMNVGEMKFEEASGVKHLREGQVARISLGGVALGTLGRLSDEIAASYKFRQPVYVAELNLSALLEAGETPVRYKPLPRHPSIVRDISLVADRKVGFGDMKGAIQNLKIEECRAVALVDVYEGANLPEGQRSVTLRVEYRADERTLRDDEADALHARVVSALETGFGARQRA